MRAIVAFCRTAARLNVPVHILAASETDPIFDTNYSQWVFRTRESAALCIDQVASWMEAIRQSGNYDRLVVLPTSEFLNQFLLNNRAALELAGCLIPLVDRALYNQISEKRSFVQICIEYQLPVPRGFESLPAHLPFAAKPLHYASRRDGRQLKPWLLTSESLLEEFHKLEDPDEFFYQELAVGRSLYLKYYISRTHHDVLFSQENLIQQCNGGSMVVARKSTLHKHPIAGQYLQMFRQLGFWGMIMVELKETPEGLLMIEANPRFWGPMQLVVDNGIPMITQFLNECGLPVDPSSAAPLSWQPPEAEFYCWSGGLTKAAQPLILHNYTERCFLQDYPDLIQNDVFLRDDTLPLYAREIREQR
jgi:hypothetical protein